MSSFKEAGTYGSSVIGPEKVYLSLPVDGAQYQIIEIPKHVADKSSVIQQVLADSESENSIKNPIILNPNFIITTDEVKKLVDALWSNSVPLFRILEQYFVAVRAVGYQTKHTLRLASTEQAVNIEEINADEVFIHKSVDPTFLKFYDLIGFNCGIEIQAAIVNTKMKYGDWENFNNNFHILTLVNESSCGIFEPLSKYALKKLVLNAIFKYTDYKNTIPDRQNREQLFECLTRNYFAENDRMDDRVRYTETIRCNDLSISKGNWVDELLLIPLEVPSPRMDEVIPDLARAMYLFQDFDWSNVVISGESIGRFLSGGDLNLFPITFCIYGTIDPEEKMIIAKRIAKHFERFMDDTKMYHDMDGKITNMISGFIFHIDVTNDFFSKYHVAEHSPNTSENCVYDGTDYLATYSCAQEFMTGRKLQRDPRDKPLPRNKINLEQTHLAYSIDKRPARVNRYDFKRWVVPENDLITDEGRIGTGRIGTVLFLHKVPRLLINDGGQGFGASSEEILTSSSVPMRTEDCELDDIIEYYSMSGGRRCMINRSIYDGSRD